MKGMCFLLEAWQGTALLSSLYSPEHPQLHQAPHEEICHRSRNHGQKKVLSCAQGVAPKKW